MVFGEGGSALCVVATLIFFLTVILFAAALRRLLKWVLRGKKAHRRVCFRVYEGKAAESKLFASVPLRKEMGFSFMLGIQILAECLRSDFGKLIQIGFIQQDRLQADHRLE